MTARGSETTDPVRVLLELRPCFDGYTGISQETRLLFSAFQDIEGISPVGLINHSKRLLARGGPRRALADDPAARSDRFGKLIVSSEDDEAATPLDDIRLRSEKYRAAGSLAAVSALRAKIPLHDVSSERFGDYLWQRLFDKALPPDRFETIRKASYVSMRPPWLTMHAVGALGRYPRLDTSGYDVMIAQTPWPSLVDRHTQLVVRYHDAFPVFHPHQIKLPAMHQEHHTSALRSNAREAMFVCTSEATRSDLLMLYPSVEERTYVIPTSVSSSFRPAPRSRDQIVDLLTSSISDERSAAEFAAQAVADDFRYLLVVSTVEPRKNHNRLLDAWERVRRRVEPGLALVVVGAPGWGSEPVLERLTATAARGTLVHLDGVPTADLRELYSNATAVVCPSVAEGFDLSGIEAMRCGAPVIASNIAVHRENYGEAALYFDAYDVDDLAAQIESVATKDRDDRRVAELVEAGRVRTELFGPERIDAQWRHLFEAIAAGRRGLR